MDFAARLGRPILRVPDQEQVSMFDTLVESVASPRTRKLLQEYQHLAKVWLVLLPLTCFCLQTCKSVTTGWSSS